MLPRENLKFVSSEMAINASKTVNSNGDRLLIITSALKTTSYRLALTLDQNSNE